MPDSVPGSLVVWVRFIFGAEDAPVVLGDGKPFIVCVRLTGVFADVIAGENDGRLDAGEKDGNTPPGDVPTE